MEVQYYLSLEDHVAYNLWLHLQSAGFIRFRIVGIVLSSVITFFALVFAAFEYYGLSVLFLIIAALWVLLILTPTRRWQIKRSLKTMIRQGRAPGIMDIRTLTLYDTHFTIDYAGQNTSVLYGAVISTGQDKQYFYYRLRSGQCGMIPLQIFASEADKTRFVQAITARGV